jgi:hypothetical protein
MRVKKRWVLGCVVGLSLPLAALAASGKPGPARAAAGRKAGSGAASARVTAPRLRVQEIVARHVAARGGLQAWRRVRSMVWSGKLDVGAGDAQARSERYARSLGDARPGGPRPVPAGAKVEAPPQQVQVPFVLALKRPDRSRMEITFAGKTAVQIFDGKSGWLLRPYLNREDWEPFTAEQAKEQRVQELEGPLIDHAAKGTRVELAGVEAVDGHAAYALKLTHRDGAVQRVWIDARTFLDVKVEGTPRRMDGKARTVWVAQRDFRRVQGVVVPYLLETSVDGYPGTHRMVVEKVAVNPPLDDARFTRPRT